VVTVVPLGVATCCEHKMYRIFLSTLLCVHEYRTDGQFTDRGRVIASLTAGGVAGVVSWIPAVPFDVVKSLIQVSTALLVEGHTWIRQ